MFLKTTQYLMFEGKDGEGDGDDGKGEENKGGDEQTFTQEQVNTFIAEEKRKLQKKQEVLVTELEGLKKSASLTVDEQKTLQNRIEELQNQSMSVEEKARRKVDEAAKKHTDELTTLTTDRDKWQNEHATLMIDTAVLKAAASNKALFHEQVAAILTPKTKLVEKLSEEGKPSGQFEPRVAFPDVDKNDKSIILDLTVNEAVKRMTELEQYGNLFEGTKQGGLGGTGSSGSSKSLDIAKLAREDPAKYRKLRKEKPELLSG